MPLEDPASSSDEHEDATTELASAVVEIPAPDGTRESSDDEDEGEDEGPPSPHSFRILDLIRFP